MEEIRAQGGKAVVIFERVAEPESAKRILEDASRHFGTVDILVNNADTLMDKIFLKMPQEDFELVLKVNIFETVYATRAAFPVMKEKGYSRIIMVTSVAGLFGNFGQTNYSTAKMGIVGLMNSLNLEAEKMSLCWR